MNRRIITLGHSPDPDDAFMFYALAAGRIPTHGFRFRHILRDIQTLNERVRRGRIDISAISFHAYPYVAGRYALLPCGASMGDGYGPVLVARRRIRRADWPKLRIAVPGKLTSAFLAFRLFLREEGLTVPDSAFLVVPFDRIFDVVGRGRADAGLLIHEGQLTYRQKGFVRLVDLGAWWKKGTGLPLPLGGNVIRKDLGADAMRKVAAILRASIAYGLKHWAEAMPHLKPYARDLDDRLTRRFVRMYVNRYTVDYGRTGRNAIAEFLDRGAQAGLVPPVGRLEFV